MSNATSPRFVIASLSIVAVAVTAWAAVAQAGPMATPTATPAQVVVDFPDPGLEAAVRRAIGKPTGPIYNSDLAGLTTLQANRLAIADLSGLEYAVDLTHLSLYTNQISDLSPLAGLTNLTYLHLAGNQISDPSPLSGLGELTVLGLGNNQISDLGALAGLTSLGWLYLYENQISDLGALEGLSNLVGVWLYDNQISDLGALEGLSNLVGVWLYDNQIVDIGPLVANPGIGDGDEIKLRANPLSVESLCVHIPALAARGVDVDPSPAATTCPSPTATPGPSATPGPTPTPSSQYCEIDIKCSEEFGLGPTDDYCYAVPVADITFHYDFFGGEAEITDSELGVIGIYTGTTLTRTVTISEGVTHTATFRAIGTVCTHGIFSDSVSVIHGQPPPTPTATPTPTISATSTQTPSSSPTASPTATATATPAATPTPRCEDSWPRTSIVTIAKGQSPANNAKVSHLIVGHIVDPAAVCRGDAPCTAHRIPVCAGTEVDIAVTGSSENANVGRGVISCDAGGCFVAAVDTVEKYRSVSADGKDTDRVTLLPQ